jgi:hypothetical protein
MLVTQSKGERDIVDYFRFYFQRVPRRWAKRHGLSTRESLRSGGLSRDLDSSIQHVDVSLVTVIY